MKKTLFITIFTIVLSSLFVGNIDAATAANTTTAVNVRSGAGVGYSKIVTLKSGVSVSLVNTTKYKGNGCSAGWYKMSYAGKTGYICSSYVKIKTVAQATVVGTIKGTTTTSVNIRNGASTSTAKAATLGKGASISLVNTTKYKGTGCLSGWYKIAYAGKAKYICSSYVKVAASAPAKVVGTIKATTTDAINVRSGASTATSKVTTLKKEATVMLVDKTKYNGTGCSGGWYKIAYNNAARYVCSNYIKIASTTTTTNSSTTTSLFNSPGGKQLDAYINENGINVRSGAGTNYSTLGEYEFGTQLKLLSNTLYNGTGCSGGWYNVQFIVDGVTKKGYVCANYVYKYSDIKATDSTYATTLKNAGFPETYIPYLTKLHKTHPNWKFVAENNGLDWNTAIAKEATNDTSLLQTNVKSYRQSDKLYDSGWGYAANKNVVAVYMDPRNFLTDKHIFQFENLSFTESTSNATTLNSMFGTSYLKSYTQTFIDASKKYGMSAMNLAARALSETGPNGNDATSGIEFTYKSKTYKGYYNLFNIGAHGGDNSLLEGLAYAAGLKGNTLYGVPWTSREKSIYGAAEFLGKGYISKGQNTTYYQKFNTSVNRSCDAYTNQYMQNIKAPSVESVGTCKSYEKVNIIDNAFTFSIPVYKNMPTYTALPQ